MYQIGLTGGIASGKSTAHVFFQQLDVFVVDHDQIAREVVAPGTQGLKALVDIFGDAILTANNALDRAQLKAIIFDDPAAKKKVEMIIHPLVFAQSSRLIAAQATTANTANTYSLIVSPLLIESGSYRQMHKLIVVDIPEQLQLSRLLARDGMTHTLAMAIIQSQSSRADKLAKADYTVDNSKDLEHLQQQVFQCHTALTQQLTPV